MGSGSETRRRLRQRIAGLGRRGVTSRVPDDVRTEIVAYVAARRRAGASWRVVADEVGFSASALAGWLRHGRAALVPVHVRPDVPPAAAAAAVVVMLPNGVRVEGLRVADLPAVLARLA
jgi:hypothetical protein